MAKVAVINDDPDFIEFVRMVLGDEGHETVTAHKGSATVELIRRESPDVILLDIVMEAWDTGFNTITMLRLQADTASIPVVICTARSPHDIDASLERTRLSGVSVLYKPFDLAQLSEALRGALSGQIRAVERNA